jgi:uncharacterized protein YndB with AHSA1/START domain
LENSIYFRILIEWFLFNQLKLITMKSTCITIQAVINAPINQVWKLYTDPSHMVNWNFAHESWCCPSASSDLRVGGGFTARMEARDGSVGFDFGGVYDVVDHESRLRYTMADAREVDVRFNEVDEGTEVVLIFDPEEMNPQVLQQQGWQAILNQFKSYVEQTI